VNYRPGKEVKYHSQKPACGISKKITLRMISFVFLDIIIVSIYYNSQIVATAGLIL
jgi:hypothetical protein